MQGFSAWKRAPSSAKHGFTLVELLVTLAVIALLAALLIPTVLAAYRKAMVLKCPIAYVAADGTVWITDMHGNSKMKVSKVKAASATVHWSTRGTYISYVSEKGLAVVNPATGWFKLMPDLGEASWVDDTTLQGTVYFGYYNELRRLDVRTAQYQVWKRLLEDGLPHGHVDAQHDPLHTGGFIVCEGEELSNPMMDVFVRDQNWNLTRIIWQDPGNNTRDFNARIDLLGEKIAWTRGRGEGPNVQYIVAWKSLDDDPSDYPMELGWKECESMAFCDWMPDGESFLVVIKQGSEMSLGVLDLYGNLLSTFSVPGGLISNQGCASYRRFLTMTGEGG